MTPAQLLLLSDWLRELALRTEPATREQRFTALALSELAKLRWHEAEFG